MATRKKKQKKLMKNYRFGNLSLNKWHSEWHLKCHQILETLVRCMRSNCKPKPNAIRIRASIIHNIWWDIFCFLSKTKCRGHLLGKGKALKYFSVIKTQSKKVQVKCNNNKKKNNIHTFMS